MSLNNSWQAGRQQRQQEVALRQQAVQQTLVEYYQARLATATHLQGERTLFREGLAQQDRMRRANFALFQAELQQFCESLQSETQQFLQSAGDRRQAMARELAVELSVFVDALQSEMSDFLAMVADDRASMSQQLKQDLQAFHVELQDSVKALRQAMQGDLSTLQADIQTFLTNCQHQRHQMSAETQQSLTTFISLLRSDVQSYLVELDMLRQQRSQELQHTLQDSRTTREADVKKLFEKFASFRADLKQFHQLLSESVWGQAKPKASVLTQTAPKFSLSVPKVAAKPTTVRSSFPQNKAPGKTIAPKATPKTATKPTVSKAMAAPKTTASVTSTSTPAPKPVVKEEVAFEKEVYSFLHEGQGARLTQIESYLGINRFQAVDALRSLIKKGLITQRDRVYLTQDALAQN